MLKGDFMPLVYNYYKDKVIKKRGKHKKKRDSYDRCQKEINTYCGK